VCEVYVCERWYVTKLCVKFVGGGGRRRRRRRRLGIQNQNKNPTQSCGEKLLNETFSTDMMYLKAALM
jgi:hypothetical protein